MINISSYCKNKGLTKEEFKQFKENIKATASAIYSQLNKDNRIYRNFNYFNSWNTDPNIKSFIIAELKKLGVEFNNDYSQYRI